ncbi:hypothetical protein PPERSA_03453 [Pseudocohnilembus persalinus]|uniref:3'(2'),5'-bisphosphate nucleotidase 1 n=1 Tax=Pseudocohnilembus persalinus TaxID=266149 RepID=A0A0V0QC78_PSEPJ|nr:hypothetical protein PPERSA_03453 [Pseudocohnilembus persalinus]|eukprot:KRW99652.1 hypothetical protein PPERSA_03453 [Pseudocohnilembus persalinus]
MKGIDDPATLADTKSQALIMKGFKNFWPNLTLIGEEDEEYKGEIEFDINSLNKQMILPSIFKDLQQNQEFDINKAIVWIDPLDGTLSYVNNELECVTNLIGLTYEEKPLMGIIAQPFQMQEDGSYIFCPKIYFSHVYQNIVYKIDMKNMQMEDYAIQINPSIHKPQEHIQNQIIVGTSKNHICSNKLQLVKNLNPDKILQYGGAGKKWIDVIEGTVDYSIYIGQGTKKWDIAAGDAIIQSLGGILTSNSGNSYMQTSIKQVKISQIISCCIQLALESSRIINSIQQTDSKNIQMKGVDDPMTVADVKAQTLIIKALRKFWPSIQIVGEEDIEYEGDLGFDVNKINLNLVQESFFNQKQDTTLNLDDIIVWVDPLDGTLSYVNNELDSVTTLIAITEKEKPVIGIIGQFYQKREEKYVYDPEVYFGYTGYGKVYQVSENKHNLKNQNYNQTIQPDILERKVVRAKKENGEDEIVLCTSKNRMTPEKLEMVNQLNADKIIRCGGAGKKVLDVIKGDCDTTLYIGKGTKKWDIGAPEALLLCQGGQLTDTKGQNYQYKKEVEHHVNQQGVLATINNQLHQKLVQITKNFVY